MAEPFKNLLSKKIIETMAAHFQRQWPEFDRHGFEAIATNKLEARELKQRTEHITNTMVQFFPADFEKAAKIMLKSLGPPLTDGITVDTANTKGIVGWATMPLANYVGLYGHDHFDLSMTLFKEITKRDSAEFGIRFFIQASPHKTLAQLKIWAHDENLHIRRLVSEGTRPRLPWATHLSMFIKDPSPVIHLLELLKDDSEEYVRRSVANNLNDIAKDHPDLVADIAQDWLHEASPDRKRLIRHACRTLIKSSHKKTLAVLGFKPAKIKYANINILTPTVVFGDVLAFTLSLQSNFNQDQAVMIDYIIHHQKANGSTSPKVFKWRTTTLTAKNTLTSTKKYTIKKITTRVYYPGLHSVEIIVNGISVAKADFQLLIP